MLELLVALALLGGTRGALPSELLQGGDGWVEMQLVAHGAMARLLGGRALRVATSLVVCWALLVSVPWTVDERQRRGILGSHERTLGLIKNASFA